MDASALLTRLCRLIGDRRWTDLTPLLHDDFVCRYAHTGEAFDRETWVRLNAEYPGFDRLVVHDVVGAGDRAAARCHVTGYADGDLVHFEVATFVTAREGRISEMTEVWADVARTPPPGTRPG
ncbi:nuclear transport factor 2 family protein [Blastococcus sp. SYSU DS0617]